MGSSQRADLIVTGATIHTADSACASPQAFATRGGRFIRVGSHEDVLRLRGSATQVLDARGLTVLPGIVDAHLHLTGLGLRLHQVDLTGTRSFHEVVERTVRFARSVPEGWVLGRGWDQNLWREATFPSHDALSEAVGDRPVALTRVDGHALIANSRAMTLANIGASTNAPPGGRIGRDSQGRPTGLFVDSAQALIDDCVPRPDQPGLVEAIRAAIAECNRWGVTAVAEPGCDEAVLAAHTALLEEGNYSMRTAAMIHDETELIERRAGIGIVQGAYAGRLWVRAIKMYADGALGSRGAAMLAPYSDDPQNSGLTLASRQRIVRVTEDALRSGFQVCVHAIGDRANRLTLDAFESALNRSAGTRDARLRVEHAQVLDPDDIPRFARLGVIASVQASHALSDMPWAQARLGDERLAGAYAWRALLDTGALVANGTDAPVEPVNPARTFAASISAHGRIDQRMSRCEALASMTSSAAYANFQEDAVGSITPGKYADFVLLDRDWMVASIEEIVATRVVATYFGGRRIYG